MFVFKYIYIYIYIYVVRCCLVAKLLWLEKVNRILPVYAVIMCLYNMVLIFIDTIWSFIEARKSPKCS